jgi:hypothetical protein
MLKRLLLASVLLVSAIPANAQTAEGEGAPEGARFQPWQRSWQCNDIRVTETAKAPGIVIYDLGGTIWGGSQFTLDLTQGTLYFNGRQCLPLRL